jgi:hypothetical protein
MRKARFTVAGALTAVILVATAAPALAAIRFTAVYYDPGTSTLTNYNLNKEYVVIKNTGSTTRHLRGWKLIDKRKASNGGTGTDQVFTFPRFRLAPGAVVRVHTGKGARTRHDLYWGKSHFVWGNSADTAFLYKASGALADTCSWMSSTDPSPANC